MNTFTAIGNLTKDPELKYVNGTALLKMSIAEDNMNKVNYWDIAVFGKTAETCAKFLQKGSKVHVAGSLENRSWEKDGVKHIRTQVNARSVDFLGKIKSDNNTNQNQSGQVAVAAESEFSTISQNTETFIDINSEQAPF